MCVTSVYEQMNLSEDIMQGQTFQSLELEDFWGERVKELQEHTLNRCYWFPKVKQKLVGYTNINTDQLFYSKASRLNGPVIHSGLNYRTRRGEGYACMPWWSLCWGTSRGCWLYLSGGGDLCRCTLCPLWPSRTPYWCSEDTAVEYS